MNLVRADAGRNKTAMGGIEMLLNEKCSQLSATKERWAEIKDATRSTDGRRKELDEM